MNPPSNFELMRRDLPRLQPPPGESVREKIDRIERDMCSEWGPDASDQIAVAAARVAWLCELQVCRPSRSPMRRLWDSIIGAIPVRKVSRYERLQRHERAQLEAVTRGIDAR